MILTSYYNGFVTKEDALALHFSDDFYRDLGI